jgi:hypothetical protein
VMEPGTRCNCEGVVIDNTLVSALRRLESHCSLAVFLSTHS